jgi:aminopeptidase N
MYGADKTIVDWNINKKKQTFTYAYKNGRRPVVIPDCNHVLPGELKDTKKPAQMLEQLVHGDDFISKRLAVSSAGRQLSDSASQAIITLALDDSLYSIRRNALGQLQNTQNEKYHKKWMSKVIAMAAGDKNNEVRAAAFEVLGSWKASQAKKEMMAVLNDSSYAVAGNALSALNKIDNDTAYVLAKTLVGSDPKTSLDAAIWSIIGKKGADEDIMLIEKKAPFVLGTKKFSFALSVSSYLKNVKSDASFKRGVDVFATMVGTENMKQYKTALAGFLFQVGSEQKENIKSDNKEVAASAQKRTDMVKDALQKLMDAEKDTQTQKDYKKMMKDTFE